MIAAVRRSLVARNPPLSPHVADGCPTGDEIASTATLPVADTNDFGDADALTLFPAEDGSVSSATGDAPVAGATEIIAKRRASKPVPPPSGSDIDALLEAFSVAGQSPMLQFRSELDEADAATPAPVPEWVLLRCRPFVVRWVVPSAAAFLVGAVSVLWGLRTLPPVSNTDIATVAARRPSPGPPVAPPVAALPVRPAPVVVTPREQPVDPPHLPVMAGMSHSAMQSFPVTRITLPPVAPRIVVDPVAVTVLARAAAPTPHAAPTTRATATPRATSGTRPTPVVAAPPARKPNAPVQLNAERRVDTPPVTPLAKFSVRTEALTAMPLAADMPRMPAAAAPAVVPAVTPAVARADAAAEEYAVRRALHTYEEASEELDVAATANVWPTVDRGALARAFATLKSQGLDFRTCSITVNDARAVANCRGTVQYVRKVGNSIPLTSEQLWVFKMRRSGADWKIDEVSASPAPVAAVQRVRGQG